MVNKGRSNGCHTCKERRIKCDEGKPVCQRCTFSKRECGGYEKKVAPMKFRNVQSTTFTTAKKRQGRSPRQENSPTGAQIVASVALTRPISPDWHDAARGFFLGPFANMGRDMASTRGFFEVIGPVLATEPQDSATSLAVSAVSHRLFSLWASDPGSDPKAGPSTSSRRPKDPVGLALRRLQSDLEDPIRSKNDATLLVAMIMQFYDNLAAVRGLKRVSRTHHDGAVALLRHRGAGIKDGKYGVFLLENVLHNEISSAIREKRPLDSESLSWLQWDAVPKNPSSALDLIGISIANLQHSFFQDPVTDAAGLWKEANSIGQNLGSWLSNVPSHWWPIRLDHIPDKDPPIVSYAGACDIYPVVQVASIWNLWRCYRLITLKILLSLSQDAGSHPSSSSLPRGHDRVLGKKVQETFDAICASVPFYLGNRGKPEAIHTFSDDTLALPSYHDIPMSELPPRVKDNGLTSQDEHVKHVLTQGPWHLASTLTHLVAITSEPKGNLLLEALRPGQMNWIRAQLGRIARMSRLDTGKPARSGGQPAAGHVVSQSAPGEKNSGQATDQIAMQEDPEDVFALAERLRHGFRMTSGS